MSKRKVLIGLIGLAVVALIAGLVFYFVIRKDSAVSNKIDAGVVQSVTKDQGEASSKAATNFEEVNLAFNTKDYEKTISSAKAYGGNTSAADITLRITAYGMCIQAAHALNKASEIEDCYAKGKALAESLTHEDAKKGWVSTLDNLRNKVTPASTGGGGDF